MDSIWKKNICLVVLYGQEEWGVHRSLAPSLWFCIQYIFLTSNWIIDKKWNTCVWFSMKSMVVGFFLVWNSMGYAKESFGFISLLERSFWLILECRYLEFTIAHLGIEQLPLELKLFYFIFYFMLYVWVDLYPEEKILERKRKGKKVVVSSVVVCELILARI